MKTKRTKPAPRRRPAAPDAIRAFSIRMPLSRISALKQRALDEGRGYGGLQAMVNEAIGAYLAPDAIAQRRALAGPFAEITGDEKKLLVGVLHVIRSDRELAAIAEALARRGARVRSAAGA